MVLRFFIVFSLFVVSCKQQEEKKVEIIRDQPANVSVGQSLYMQHCSSCHGCDGTMQESGAKPLKTSQFTEAQIGMQIKQGKNAMPRFEGILSDDEIKEVAKFAKGLQK
jgi:mono/diheme cytochrome c family protein